MPKIKLKARDRSSRRNNRRDELLRACATLVSVLAFSCIVSVITTDIILHPRRHPRIYRTARFIQHSHPRIAKALAYTPLTCFIALELSVVALPLLTKHDWRRKGLLIPAQLKSADYLNHKRTTVEPNVGPVTWEILKDTLPAMYIKVDDIRATHWELVEIDERRQHMKLSLTYVHNPLLIKPHKLFPRRLECYASVKSIGVRSELTIEFCAPSTMDYQTVFAVVDETYRTLASRLERRRDGARVS